MVTAFFAFVKIRDKRLNCWSGKLSINVLYTDWQCMKQHPKSTAAQHSHRIWGTSTYIATGLLKAFSVIEGRRRFTSYIYCKSRGYDIIFILRLECWKGRKGVKPDNTNHRMRMFWFSLESLTLLPNLFHLVLCKIYTGLRFLSF